MRHEEKIANGKLVSFEVWAEDGKVTDVRITGDFFLHPEDALHGLEAALKGIPLSTGEAEVAHLISSFLKAANATLIGATAEDFARIFARAVAS